MIATYDQYLQRTRSLSFTEMRKLHQEMSVEIGDDADALEIYDELIDTATRYARLTAERTVIDTAKKTIKGDQKSSRNSVIIKMNVLSRYLQTLGEKAAWRDVLGRNEHDLYTQKRIGSFACFLVFINCLNAD